MRWVVCRTADDAADIVCGGECAVLLMMQLIYCMRWAVCCTADDAADILHAVGSVPYC